MLSPVNGILLVLCIWILSMLYVLCVIWKWNLLNICSSLVSLHGLSGENLLGPRTLWYWVTCPLWIGLKLFWIRLPILAFPKSINLILPSLGLFLWTLYGSPVIRSSMGNLLWMSSVHWLLSNDYIRSTSRRGSLFLIP